MISSPETTKVIKSGKSEEPFLLFIGNRKKIDGTVKEINTKILAPLLVILVAAVLFLLIYFFLSGKLG